METVNQNSGANPSVLSISDSPGKSGKGGQRHYKIGVTIQPHEAARKLFAEIFGRSAQLDDGIEEDVLLLEKKGKFNGVIA